MVGTIQRRTLVRLASTVLGVRFSACMASHLTDHVLTVARPSCSVGVPPLAAFWRLASRSRRSTAARLVAVTTRRRRAPVEVNPSS